MPRVNYREISGRFTHIDAEFVGASIVSPDDEASYSVRFYPWWEHPLYHEAKSKNKPWAFGDFTEGKVTVTVFAHHVHTFHLSPTDGEVIDWLFTDDHPLLWDHYPSYQVLCTTPLTSDQLTEIIDLVRAQVGLDDNPYRYFN